MLYQTSTTETWCCCCNICWPRKWTFDTCFMVALLKHGVANLKEVLADRHQQLSAVGHNRPMRTEGGTGCAGGRGREMWGGKNPQTSEERVAGERGDVQEGAHKQELSVRQDFHKGSRQLQPTATWALQTVGGPSSGVGPGRRRAGGDAGELVHRKTSQLQECWQGFSGVEVKPERSGVIFSSSESGTDEETDGLEEFGESGRRLAQPFRPPLLCILIYCRITGKLNSYPLSTLLFI